MSDEKEIKRSHDDVKQAAGGTSAVKELSVEGLEQVTGGAADQYSNLEGIKGEQGDDKHKEW